jgi:nucleotide-binding universal stress UspA family protein
MTEIIVGVDPSVDAAAALRWAVREGRWREAEVRAVLVWDLLGQPHAATDAGFDPGYDQAAAEAVLAEAVTDALGEAAAGEVARTAVCDRPAYGLLEQAAKADLLVVGGRGRGGFTGLLLGSVSGQLLQYAPCPVAVVRASAEDHASDEPGRVVVGIDGSATSRRALRWAFEAARHRGTDLEVLHAWHRPVVESGAAEQAARKVVDEAVAEALTDATIDARAAQEVEVRRVVVSGSPAAALLQAALGADLLVLGARGRGGFKRLLLGSVSQQVTQHVTCPVVVIPPADR